MNRTFSAFSFIVVCVLAGPAFARPPSSPLGPNGNGRGVWQTEWSKYFFKCWDAGRSKDARNHPVHELTPNLDDVGEGKAWCGVSGVADSGSPEKIKLFYLSIFKDLARAESSLNPDAEGRNGDRQPTGLLQMDSIDARFNGCLTSSGGVFKEDDDLKDPEGNICCAVKIVLNGAKARKGKLPKFLATAKKGLMGRFWQPLREGTGSDGKGGTTNDSVVSRKIKESVRKDCSMIADECREENGSTLTKIDCQLAKPEKTADIPQDGEQ